MTTRENITLIAKILARATSPEANEAAAAVEAAYKRMRRDQVSVKQLLSLPLVELYQVPLVKLVMHILSQQQDLSPGEQRKAFENYMAMITARFAAGEDVEDEASREQERQRQEDQHRAREAVRAAQEKARRESEEQERQRQRAAQEKARRVSEEQERQRQHSPQEKARRAGYGTVLVVLAIAFALWLATLKSPSTEPTPLIALGPSTSPPTSSDIGPAPPASPTPVATLAKVNLDFGGFLELDLVESIQVKQGQTLFADVGSGRLPLVVEKIDGRRVGAIPQVPIDQYIQGMKVYEASK